MYKISKNIISFIILSLVFTILFAFTIKDDEEYVSNYLLELNYSLIKLDQAGDNFNRNIITADSIQKVFLKAREDYKKAEFLLAFYHPEYISGNINGAPLLHLEIENSRPIISNPVGFQVLDELIFSDEIASQKNEIANLTRRLKDNFAKLYDDIKSESYDYNLNIVAMRLQLVRIFALGITGFDTPGSINAKQDAISSIEGMRFFFNERYHQNLDKQKVEGINLLFNESIQFLSSQNSFEQIDRFTFLRKYLNPLYKELESVQGTVDVKLLSNLTSWNSKSKSIFGSDFLDPYYFTSLKKEDDSNELRTLGEKLFFDTVLSNDSAISCASCHSPQKAFTDGNAKSESNVLGKTVLRNSPTLLNAVFADRYFYDLRAFTLEQQVEHVIFNNEEFNTSYASILEKLNKKTEYKTLFKKTFGSKNITRQDFAKALASYVLSLQSFNSSFDKLVKGESIENEEGIKNGFNLFMGKANCATCHFPPTFSGLVPPFFRENESEILGVLQNPTSNFLDEDQGRSVNQIGTENSWIFEKSFKTVTLRNVELTAPYFHNGAFQTLEEVIDFYNDGGGQGKGIFVQNQTLPSDKLELKDNEKKDLILFMKSLSDNSYQ